MPEIPNLVRLKTRNWRSFDCDAWKDLGKGDIDTWRAATEVFREWPFNHELGSAILRCNLEALAQDRINSVITGEDLREGRIGWEEFSRRNTTEYVEWSIDVCPKNGKTNAKWAAETFLYDFFLIMNLAFCGSFEIYNTSFVGDTHDPWFRVSSNCLELCLIDSYEASWPKVGLLDLKLVSDWYQQVRPVSAQIPQQTLERVLLSILYIANRYGQIDAVVWLFYAFETLVSAKVGENRRILIERISLIINPCESEYSSLKKTIGELYDIRSSFVHGGFSIVHPMINEQLDEKVNSHTHRILKVTESGLRILLSILQELIRAGRTSLEFKEVIL